MTNISIVKAIFAIILLRSNTNANVVFLKAPSRTITAFPGEAITIGCVISGLTDDHVVKWILENDIISRNHKIMEEFKNSFTISQRWEDFSLMFKTEANYEYLDLYLSVLDKNEATVLYSLTKLSVAWTIPEPNCARLSVGMSVSEGEFMRMMCQSSQSHEPDIEFTWSSNDVIVSPGKLVFNLYAFEITRSDHNAKFTCNATRQSTGETRSCSVDTLTVNYAPTVYVRHTSLLVYVCDVDARPSATPTWITGPKIPLHSYNVEDYATFSITNADSVLEGAILSCTASNIVGVGRDMIKITKNEPTTIVPTYEENGRPTVPYKNKADVDNTNFAMIIGLVLGAFALTVTTGLFTFGCCKKRSNRQKAKRPQVSYGNDIDTSQEVYLAAQLELGTHEQRSKKDSPSPYEVIGTNKANSVTNAIPIVAGSARSVAPNENSPKTSPGYTNIALNNDAVLVMPKTNSNVRCPPVKSARNTIHATEEHTTAMLDVKQDSVITYASVVPRSKRASKENKTKSIHADFCLSSEMIAKTSAGRAKQDPCLGYAIVVPKSKRNMNATTNLTDNQSENNTVDQPQGLSVNKKQNSRFGYTNVVAASGRKVAVDESNKRASCDFIIDDKLPHPDKQEYDHNKMSENSKATTKQAYTVVIPKSKRTVNVNQVDNTDVNNSTDCRISYADIDFSKVRHDGKQRKASKESRVSYADIDFSQANSRQNRKSYTPVIPKSQRNQEAKNNSLGNK